MAAAPAPSALAKLPLVAKIAIGTALLVLAGVVYFVIFYGDLASSISAEQQKEHGLRRDLEEARKAEHAYQKDLAELHDRQQRQRELNKVLPASTEYPAFLSSIQSVANVAGVELRAWTPQAEAAEQFYARVPMKVDLSGRFHQIAKFFYNIGQLDRIINIENITIGKSTKVKGDDVVLEVSALATAFHSIEPGAAKKAPAADKGKKK